MARSIIGGMISNENTIGVSNAVQRKEKAETRSQRVNFLIRPSVYLEVKAKCAEMDISVGEAINQLLEKWIKE